MRHGVVRDRPVVVAALEIHIGPTPVGNVVPWIFLKGGRQRGEDLVVLGGLNVQRWE